MHDPDFKFRFALFFQFVQLYIKRIKRALFLFTQPNGREN